LKNGIEKQEDLSEGILLVAVPDGCRAGNLVGPAFWVAAWPRLLTFAATLQFAGIL
jgi:hypothetical protein